MGLTSHSGILAITIYYHDYYQYYYFFYCYYYFTSTGQVLHIVKHLTFYKTSTSHSEVFDITIITTITTATTTTTTTTTTMTTTTATNAVKMHVTTREAKQGSMSNCHAR